MELRVLKYFLMIAREENITKAAQLLHITQPTLSRQIMQLEDELGVKLFERGSHVVSLTEDGMLLKRRAAELIELADKTQREFQHKEDNIAGEITIGSGELLEMRFMAKTMADFRKQYPLVTFSMYSGNTDNIKERVENGLIDIGICPDPVDIGRYEYVKIPIEEQWGILVRDDSPLAEQPAVTVDELTALPLMIPQRDLVQSMLANWFGSERYERLDIVEKYNLLYNTAIMVQCGLGTAIGMRLDSQFDGLSFVPLEPPLYGRSVVIWKKNQVFSATAECFIKYLKKCSESMAGDVI